MCLDNVPVRYILDGKVIALHTDGSSHVPPPKYDIKQVIKRGPFHTWVTV